MVMFALRSAVCITAVVLALPGRRDPEPDTAAVARNAAQVAVSAAGSLCGGALGPCASLAAATMAGMTPIPARRPAPPRRAPVPRPE